MTAEYLATKEAVAAAANELEIGEGTVAQWLDRGAVLRWDRPGVINSDDVAHASRVLHGIYDITRDKRHGCLILSAFIGKIPQHELAHDEVFLSHWDGTPEQCYRCK
jgi:hypothetical protein